MATIVRVDVLDSDTLEIQLNNGSIILLNVAPLLQESRFAQLAEGDNFLHPETDGASIYWSNGIRMLLNEVFTMLTVSSIGSNVRESAG